MKKNEHMLNPTLRMIINKFRYFMKSTLGGAIRLTGFDKPTVWTIMTPLAIKTESINLVRLFLFRDKDFLHGSHHNFTNTISKKLLQIAIINMLGHMAHLIILKRSQNTTRKLLKI